MPPAPVYRRQLMGVARYRSSDEDSARWEGFAFRNGDIVISTRSKHGTTWVQMICALLVFQTPRLPARLSELSPWLDWLVEPRDDVVARLASQPHRRVIKTHTPLDGIPQHAGVTYVVVARHPLDAAVSLYHQGDNLDRHRLQELTGQGGPTGRTRPPLREWLAGWVHRDADAVADLDSLPGVMRHLNDAWDRRHEPNVVLLHYRDLADDLDGAMRSLAVRLGIAIDDLVWPSLVQAATFSEMRSRAGDLAPDRLGVLKRPSAFFRAGVSGAGRQALSPEDYRAYLIRAAHLARPGLVEWLHRPD